MYELLTRLFTSINQSVLGSKGRQQVGQCQAWASPECRAWQVGCDPLWWRRGRTRGWIWSGDLSKKPGRISLRRITRLRLCLSSLNDWKALTLTLEKLGSCRAKTSTFWMSARSGSDSSLTSDSEAVSI